MRFPIAVHPTGDVRINSRLITPKRRRPERTTIIPGDARLSAAKAVRGTTNGLRRAAIRNPLERLAYGES